MDHSSPFGLVPTTERGVTLCPGCVRTGSCQIGMLSQIVEGNGNSVAEIACPGHFQGGPGVAFGGWVAMAFDHVFGAIPMKLGVGGLTVSLSVEYLKPVPVEVPMTLHAQAEDRVGRRWKFTGQLLLPDGTAAATARSELVEPAADHFDRYRRPDSETVEH
jgi:acyl-coenzyme A thioesterase PaaI-like protein